MCSHGANPQLPNNSDLNIIALSQTLKNTNNSYKFLWMLGLLDSLPESTALSASFIKIPMKNVLVEMIKQAICPIKEYRLFFGSFDRMEEFLSNKQLLAAIEKNEFSDKSVVHTCRKLAEYVPQQWLRPFFEGKEEMPKPSYAVSIAIRKFSSKYFQSNSPPPYCFSEKTKRGNFLDIKFHPGWFTYFKQNREIIRGWVLYHWIDYLQKRNPNTPAIISKIIYPKQRFDLGKEREWWKWIMRDLGYIECIYSGQKLTAHSTFHLDHYIPWSFIGHNRLWNLIPTIESVNIKKRDSLPSNLYFTRFVGLQHKAITSYSKEHNKNKSGWKDMVNAYVNDLRISSVTNPPELSHFKTVYNNTIPPLISLASTQGFKKDWRL